MLHRATSLAVLLAVAAGCGTKSDTAAARGDPAPADEPVPADAPDLGIAVVDPFRWALSDAALVELSVEAAAGDLTVSAGPGGLTVHDFPVGGALHQLGFRRGDVIATIDGTALTDLAVLENIYQRARDAGAVELSIRRGTEILERTLYLLDPLRYSLAPVVAISADSADAELLRAVATGVRQTRAERLDLRYDVDTLVVKTLAETPALLGLPRYGRRPSPTTDSTVLSALGLTPYDTIQSLDEHTIHTGPSLARALENLGAARSFSLSIVRIKTPLVIRYQIVDDLVMDAQLAAAVARWQEARPLADSSGRAADSADPTLPDPVIAGIEELGPDRYAIDRSVLPLLADITGRRLARVVPAMENGRPVGIKVYAMRPNSPLAKAGIRNGDTIHAVGGTPLESFDDLGAVLAAAARTSTVTVEITRRGKPVILTYELR
ncbi:MAG TPA: PDZ domain-containing protein [Kofleriaceae bacterium]|nr:PDZ domain-containing protein [Kofleriaceae bacterium]